MKIVNEWKVPEGSGIPLLTMPNIPKPLHGDGMQPRTIVGKTEWDKMRKACYEEHDDVCEICGTKCRSTREGDLPLHQCHELFSYDFVECIAKFERLCCICYRCHMFIHSGRAITMYRNHNPWHTKDYMVDLARHGFELISKWNKLHPDEEPLRLWSTIVGWCNEPSLGNAISQMIDDYDIHFYSAPNAMGENGTWNKWKLIYDGEEYYSPYQDDRDWEVAMDKKSGIDNTSLFVGDEFEELRRNIKA